MTNHLNSKQDHGNTDVASEVTEYGRVETRTGRVSQHISGLGSCTGGTSFNLLIITFTIFAVLNLIGVVGGCL